MINPSVGQCADNPGDTIFVADDEQALQFCNQRASSLKAASLGLLLRFRETQLLAPTAFAAPMERLLHPTMRVTSGETGKPGRVLPFHQSVVDIKRNLQNSCGNLRRFDSAT